MSTKSFFAAGTPATFATSGEIPWRDAVVEQAPSPCFNGDEDGLSLEFTLESFVRQGHHFDVDNLCEPVLYALVGQRAWFQGKRARIRWLRATKRVASPLGCHITVSCGKTPELPSEAPDWDEEYTGILPTSARSPELATWARELLWTSQPGPPTSATYQPVSSRPLSIASIRGSAAWNNGPRITGSTS